MSRSPILELPRLRSAEFEFRVPEEHKVEGVIVLRERFERDFALTHLVAANCAVDPQRPKEPSDFVVKGGFALRHLYDSIRYSKDADFAMSGSDLEIVGHPDDLAVPPGMEIVGAPLSESNEVFKIKIKYRTSEGFHDFIFCDLNSNERPIQRPPKDLPLKSPFVASFMVWSSQLDEIVGEKLFAFIDRRLTRIKDVYDLHHVLRNRGLPVSAAHVEPIYSRFRTIKRRGGPFADLPVAFRQVLAPDWSPGGPYTPSREAEAAWASEVADLRPRPDLSSVSDELFGLMVERLGMSDAHR